MKIKIKTDDGEKEIELKNPKGRHTKKGLKLLIASEKSEDQVGAIDKYMDYLDEISAEGSGMTVEELDDLDDDEKKKIISHYQKKIESKFDFLKSSLNVENSVQKDTPK